MLQELISAIFVMFNVGMSQATDISLPPLTPYPTDMKNTSIKSIIEGLGLVYESYGVTTRDGYILNLNRMINPNKEEDRDKGIPVLFVHGLQMYSETWFLQSKPEHNIPVAYLLRGYDIWLGDQRGTIRSNRHVNLSADDYEFWNFSFHETGVYDLPAFIDFILKETRRKKLVYSGVSLGATFYYVLCSEKPEYQRKLYGGILFQPLGEAPKIEELSMGAQLSMKLFDLNMFLQSTLGSGQSLPDIRRSKILGYLSCKIQPFAVVSSLTGFSTGVGCKFDKRSFCAKIAISLGGTSVRTVIHTFQLFFNGGNFTKYDWGSAKENMRKYGATRPPEYDVSKIKKFTAVYVSDIDEYAPTRKVVPFIRKFSGPNYICRYPNVCHIFTEYDNRIGPYVEDSADVLDSMTWRSSGTKMRSKTCKVDPVIESDETNFGKTEELLSGMKEFIVQLLPQFISQYL